MGRIMTARMRPKQRHAAIVAKRYEIIWRKEYAQQTEIDIKNAQRIDKPLSNNNYFSGDNVKPSLIFYRANLLKVLLFICCFFEIVHMFTCSHVLFTLILWNFLFHTLLYEIFIIFRSLIFLQKTSITSKNQRWVFWKSQSLFQPYLNSSHDVG